MADLLNGFFSSVFTREDLTSIPTARRPSKKWRSQRKVYKLRSEISNHSLQQAQTELAHSYYRSCSRS
jgi:hypothetical protein